MKNYSQIVVFRLQDSHASAGRSFRRIRRAIIILTILWGVLAGAAALAAEDLDSDGDVDGRDLWQYVDTGIFADIDLFAGAYGGPDPGTGNLAVDKTVTCSSQESENPAANVVDGNTADTRWSGSTNSYPQWVEIDLGSTYTINQTVLFPYNNRAYRYKVEVSTDGANYTQVVDRTDNTTGGASITDNFSSTSARYVKLTVTGAYDYSGGWTSILEFEVYASEENATQISQFGITWTFDRQYQYGQFVNGDYWVVGPVVITDITQSSNMAERDGSMLNPMPGIAHGYDGRVSGYDPALDVSNQLPSLLIAPDASLVSTISRVPQETVRALRRPALEVAAVLTVLAEPPPAGSFRPPYGGNDKPLYASDNLRTDLLLQLAPVASAPSMAQMEAVFEKPWIDARLEWEGDDLHPRLNMQNYGAGMSLDVGHGALRLLLDDPVAEKQTLLIRYVQLGIDNFGLVENGGNWGSVGGTIGVGRKTLPSTTSPNTSSRRTVRRFTSPRQPRRPPTTPTTAVAALTFVTPVTMTRSTWAPRSGVIATIVG